ncbi:hypothetical protein UNDYM_3187 [Undibacterium sp. YM2]|nr:hypothetical protein UNDYM_3187 [Undibacterium sp. YM2]
MQTDFNDYEIDAPGDDGDQGGKDVRGFHRALWVKTALHTNSKQDLLQSASIFTYGGFAGGACYFTTRSGDMMAFR